MTQSVVRLIYLFGSLLAFVGLACLGSAAGGRSRNAPVANPDPTAATAGVTIDVEAHEFEFTLDRSSADPGEVTFVVRNTGQMPHDFAITGPGVNAKTPLLNPGETADLQVTLPAGDYTYVCTVPGHAQLGMTGTFTVDG